MLCVCAVDVSVNMSRLFSYLCSPAVAWLGCDCFKCNWGTSRSGCIPSFKRKNKLKQEKKKVRGRVSNKWERGFVRDRSLAGRCPSYAGSCICSHPRRHLFIKQQYKNSAGQPYSAAEAAFSIISQVYYGLRLKSMPRPKAHCRHTFPSICIFWSWTHSTCLHDPLFFPLFRDSVVVFFLFPLLLHLKPVFAEVQRELTKHFQMKREDLHSLFPRESSFPSLSSSLYACPFLLSSILHCLILYLSLPAISVVLLSMVLHFVLAIYI